jgi:hypothetical protein
MIPAVDQAAIVVHVITVTVAVDARILTASGMAITPHVVLPILIVINIFQLNKIINFKL